MKLTIKVEEYRQHIDLWLTLFQSGAGFTVREKSILIEILVRRKELVDSNISEPFLTKLLFDEDSRKLFCERLEISHQILNNIIMSLKKKDIISNDFKLQSTLIPEDRLEFNFKYDNK